MPRFFTSFDKDILYKGSLADIHVFSGTNLYTARHTEAGSYKGGIEIDFFILPIKIIFLVSFFHRKEELITFTCLNLVLRIKE